jgi:hypothetical protein
VESVGTLFDNLDDAKKCPRIQIDWGQRVLTWCQDHALREEKRESAFANIAIRVASGKIVPNPIRTTALFI